MKQSGAVKKFRAALCQMSRPALLCRALVVGVVLTILVERSIAATTVAQISSYNPVEPLREVNGRNIVRSSTGVMHILFHTLPGGTRKLAHAISPNNGITWGSSEIASEVSEGSSVAADSNGNIYVVYRWSDLVYRKYNGSSWGSPISVNVAGGEVPSIATDGSSNSLVAWTIVPWQGEPYHAWYRKVKNDGTMESTNDLDRGQMPTVVYHPQSNDFVIAWQGSSTSCTGLCVKFLSQETIWNLGNGGSPSLAVDSTGVVHMAYQFGDVKYVKFASPTSGPSTIETVPQSTYGYSISLSVGSDDKPVVFFEMGSPVYVIRRDCRNKPILQGVV